MAASITEQIADWVSSPDPGISADARRVGRLAILDVLGTTIGARRSPDYGVLDFLVSSGNPGKPTLLGRAGHLDAPRSAFVNSYAAHLLDFDDSSGDMAGHPTAVVFPAALATANDVGSTGADLLDAYIVGVEVSCRLGRLVNPQHYDHGWHPSATLGGIGAAAASARLLGLSSEQTASALGLAVAFANGLKASFGTPAKPLQVARASESGVLAAYLARSGAYSRADIFEHKQGFLRVFDSREPESVSFRFGSEGWSILTPGIIIKQYPCCGSTHSAVESARALAPLSADDIKEVRIELHPRRRTHVDRPAPSTALEAKFSVQYTVARALLSGNVTLDDFTSEHVSTPEIRTLLDRTVVHDLDAPDDRVEDRYGARVTVTLRDGSELVEFTPVALGRAPGEMLAADRIVEKFHGCVDATLGFARAADLLAAVTTLDALSDGPAQILALSAVG